MKCWRLRKMAEEQGRFLFEIRASIPASSRREAVEKLKQYLSLIVEKLEEE